MPLRRETMWLMLAAHGSLKALSHLPLQMRSLEEKPLSLGNIY
jgi:hypothetical protein